VIDLGDRRFEVIHTPGHSPGGIALWEAATGILFSGDIVYDGPLIEDTYHADAAAYVGSMERLLALPVRVVHGGHFPSYGGDRHRDLIRRWLAGKVAGRAG
jgi:glyoxylase-like metal-dependent hydrolase (beta-lactamase superfamily II)